jgi:hypothetical protein
MQMQWKIDYFKDDKRTAFTFPSENLSSAIEYWEKHTKLNPNIHIFKISNITVMMKCNKCLNHNQFNNIQGDGFCKKHNYRFYMGNEKQPCPQCANENNLCHDCGENIL